MAIMDVFLFPSRWEGFGNVLIEAQSTGIKCVISDKVPEGVKITDYVKAVPLDEKNDKWIEEILRPIDVHVDVNGLKDFNMINSVKKLQSIYLE